MSREPEPQIGALVVAEGLEIEEEALSALELGADLLQGYLLGRPAADGSIMMSSRSMNAMPVSRLRICLT